jgi:hypothetical protein
MVNAILRVKKIGRARLAVMTQEGCLMFTVTKKATKKESSMMRCLVEEMKRDQMARRFVDLGKPRELGRWTPDACCKSNLVPLSVYFLSNCRDCLSRDWVCPASSPPSCFPLHSFPSPRDQR